MHDFHCNGDVAIMKKETLRGLSLMYAIKTDIAYIHVGR